MSHRVKKVEHLDKYRLKLLFDNGTVKIVDLIEITKKPNKLFLPLRDLIYFQQVTCDGFSIVWPNGVDLCPDALYAMGTPVRHKRTASPKTARKRRRKTTASKRPQRNI